MTVAVNGQLQIKLKFYIENITSEEHLCIVFTIYTVLECFRF